MPIQIVLAKMEMYGFGLNKDYLIELNNTVNNLMENISHQVLELSGTKFNMHSTVEWAKVRIYNNYLFGNQFYIVYFIY